MYQMIPTKPLGRRRSVNAERQAAIFKAHYAEPKQTVVAKPKRGRKAKAAK